MSADLYAAFGVGDPSTPTPPPGPQAPARVDSHVGTFEKPSSASDPTRSSHAKALPTNSRSTHRGAETDQGEVLFDADHEDLDPDPDPDVDEFGDFETIHDAPPERAAVNKDHHKAPSTQASNLLDLDDAFVPVTRPPTAPIAVWTASSPSPNPGPREPRATAACATDDDWGHFELAQLEASSSREEPRSGVIASGDRSDASLRAPAFPSRLEVGADDEPEEPWEPFEDGDPAKKLGNSLPQATATATDTTTTSVPATRATNGRTQERPTNIPPPSALLQLLSAEFQEVRSPSRSAAHGAPTDAVAQILILFRSGSRIVAGRTWRWKRDAILAQSVRMGQASKSGGMKLASVNKGESAREDRDVEEMMRDWAKVLHDFGPDLGRAHHAPHRMKMSASPPLKTLPPVASPDLAKPCAVCGLTRIERLVNVDVDVNDIFGEFWVDHWGHNDCYDFWYAYKGLLGQR